jgi:hypothetical protein
VVQWCTQIPGCSAARLYHLPQYLRGVMRRGEAQPSKKFESYIWFDWKAQGCSNFFEGCASPRRITPRRYWGRCLDNGLWDVHHCTTGKQCNPDFEQRKVKSRVVQLPGEINAMSGKSEGHRSHILHTSGSTGKPKAVQISSKAVYLRGVMRRGEAQPSKKFEQPWAFQSNQMYEEYDFCDLLISQTSH